MLDFQYAEKLKLHPEIGGNLHFDISQTQVLGQSLPSQTMIGSIGQSGIIIGFSQVQHFVTSHVHI